MAYLGPYPTSRQSPQMSLLPHNSLHRHSFIVTMASLDPAPASQPSLQALNFLRSPSVVEGWRVVVLSQLSAASTFQAEAILPSQPPTWLRLQAQHLPHCGPPKPSSQPFSSFYTPSSRLPVASSGPWGSFLTTAFPVPVFPFRRPLRAENLLKSASPDPLAPSRRPLRAKLLFLAASPGLTPASQQPLWTQCLPISWRPWSAHSFLKPSSPGPGQASRCPLHDELLPSNGTCSPQMVSGRWAPPRQAWASR
nr:putative uncharacterized protein FLJ44672 [Gorilla gorilla gorilla]